VDPAIVAANPVADGGRPARPDLAGATNTPSDDVRIAFAD
jgi:hypothetical protein